MPPLTRAMAKKQPGADATQRERREWEADILQLQQVSKVTRSRCSLDTGRTFDEGYVLDQSLMPCDPYRCSHRDELFGSCEYRASPTSNDTPLTDHSDTWDDRFSVPRPLHPECGLLKPLRQLTIYLARIFTTTSEQRLSKLLLRDYMRQS